MVTQQRNSPKLDQQFLWDAPQIIDAQIKQVLMFRKLPRKNMPKNKTFLHYVTYLTAKQKDDCLYLLSGCTKKHINNLHTNRHKKIVHILANSRRTNPLTRCFTLINISIFKQHDDIQHLTIMATSHAHATFESTNAPPSCSWTKFVFQAQHPRPNPLTPNHNLKIQICEFTNYNNNNIPLKATTRKLDKYYILQIGNIGHYVVYGIAKGLKQMSIDFKVLCPLSTNVILSVNISNYSK